MYAKIDLSFPVKSENHRRVGSGGGRGSGGSRGGRRRKADWDTHDLTDFEEQLEEVTEPVFGQEAVVQIHLQPPEVEAVKKAAQSRGIDGVGF